MAKQQRVQGDFGSWQDASTVIQTVMAALPGLIIEVRYVDGWYQVLIPSHPKIEEWLQGVMENVYSPYTGYIVNN